MAAAQPIRPRRELASRESDGIEVTLLWDAETDRLTVCVGDSRCGARFELDAERDNALDVFHHPYSYAAVRGIPYGGSHCPSAPPAAEPSRLAA